MKKKITFLVEQMESPSTRYRVLQYLPSLEEMGFQAKVIPISKGIRNHFAIFNALQDSDLVFLQRRLFQPWEFAFLRGKAKKLIFDFDDAVMYRDPNRTRPASLLRRFKFRTAVSRSDGVMAGNEYLAGKARKFNPKVLVVPTAVDLALYTGECEPDPKGKTTIGWIGSPSTSFYLALLRRALARLGRRHSDLRLLLVGVEGFDKAGLEDLEIVEEPWSREKEVSCLFRMDVGIAPLTDDPWSRGKCGLKILQYFAAGRPAVASPVGVHNELVDDGRNGFLARGEEEWVEKLSMLIEERTQRISMGREGRMKIARSYSVEAVAPVLNNFILEVLSLDSRR